VSITPNQLFSGPIRFLKAVVDPGAMPPDTIPEFAFCGRSNVGKSSLVNALTGRGTLARTSNTPGRTQQLILFDMGADEERPIARLVDMPGYGYATAPKTMVMAWTKMVRSYLRGRPNLTRVLVLIDSRHGAKDTDEDMMKMLDEAAVSYQIVLTKADKLSAAAQVKAKEAAQIIARAHIAAHPEILLTSSEKDWGITDLREILTQLVIGNK
jgi:GTP-binding protein